MKAPSQPSAPSAIGVRLSVMMFLQFFVWGAWYVSMTGWMGTVGLGDLTTTTWAFTVGPIAACISPFFLGLIADRYFASQRVLGVLHLLGGAALLAVPSIVASTSPERAKDFTHPYVLALLAHMLCYMPTLGLTNTLSFHNMTNPEKQFPIVRVFGTIGWIVGNIAVSWLPEGDKSPAQFHLAGGAAVLLGVFAFTLPHTPPPAAGKTASMRELLGLDSLKLFAHPGYLVFIVCSFLICIPLAAYYIQARNFAEFTGFERPTFTMSFGQMSEIVFMVAMPLFFARLGVKWMLAVGMLAWVVRYALFGYAAEDHVMWAVLGGILLHGICYDFFFVTGFLYVDRVAPRELRGQAQGFLVLVTQGLGLGVGAKVVGALAESHTTVSGETKTLDWGPFWMTLSVTALVVLVAFVLLFRDRSQPAPAR